MLLCLLMALVLGGCFEPVPEASRWHRSSHDGGASQDASDTDEPDATPSSVPDAALRADAAIHRDASTGIDAGCTSFLDRGVCLEHTPTCASDTDCDPATYHGCYLPSGHCRAWTTCSCSHDTDCAAGAICLTNERVCGGCFPMTSCSSAVDCAGGLPCIAGRCQKPCCAGPDGGS